MIEVSVTELVFTAALVDGQELEHHDHVFRIFGAHRGVVSVIGERVVEEYVGAERRGMYDYDLLLDNIRIEVKTNEVRERPKPYYLCNVSDHSGGENSGGQDCDYYVFCFVNLDTRKAWIAGCISREEFLDKCVHHDAGDVLPYAGFTFLNPCKSVTVEQLHPVEELRIQGGMS